MFCSQCEHKVDRSTDILILILRDKERVVGILLIKKASEIFCVEKTNNVRS